MALWFTICWGQNQQTFRWDSHSYSSISLSLPWANTIEIQSTTNSDVILRYQSEGEYQNDLMLQATADEKILVINERIGPSFFSHKGKLSVHKVLAAKLELLLPRFIHLNLNAEHANLKLKGSFNNIQLKINEGSVFVDGRYAAGKIITEQANIELLAVQNHVFAQTKKGEIQGTFSSKEKSNLTLESERGNISILSNRK